MPAETPAVPQTLLKEVAKATAQGQTLARVVNSLASHGVLPYLSRLYLFFFMIGSCQDAGAQLKQWDVPLPDGEVTYIDTHTAEMFLATGSEHETLAYNELRRLLKTAMTTIKANNRFAEVTRLQEMA